MDEWLYRLPSAATDPDVQEALSRRYGNDIIMLLPLKSGKVAVFNCARELCAVIKPAHDDDEYHTWGRITDSVKQPEPASPKTVDLEELGLI